MSQVNEIEVIENEIETYKAIQAKSKLIKDFKESDVFTKAIKPVFLDGYRETSSSNCDKFNEQQTINFVHGMKARAIFEDFIDRSIEDGLIAESTVEELEEELKIAKKNLD